MSVETEQASGYAAVKLRLGMPVAPPARVRRDLIPPPPKERAPLSWPVQADASPYDEAAPRAVTPTSIINEVCAAYRMTREDLCSHSHKHLFVIARDEATFRMSVQLDMTREAIGFRLNRDRTSILAALRRYAKRTPGAIDALRRTRIKRESNRQAMLREACELYLSGWSMKQVMNKFPTSRGTIRKMLEQRRIAVEGSR